MSSAATRRRPSRDGRSPVVIGLVNNMPDGALQATERQFEDLLRAAAGGQEVGLRYLALPEIQRGEHARAHMHGRYAHIDRLPAAGLDGLIVTGAEPKTARLEDELYWPSLTRVIDWSRAAEVPTIWSCLAAHAAVLRLDGVERRLLESKRTGVFLCALAQPNALLADSPEPIPVPHSRWNDIAEADLAAAGYEVLTRSPEIGVDSFIKSGPAMSLFFQGHPEYAAEALMHEYLRDVGRYLRGDRETQPTVPVGYFDRRAGAVLEDLARRDIGSRSPERIDDYEKAAGSAALKAGWRPWAVSVYRAWLHHIAQRKSVGVGRRQTSSIG